MLPDGWTKDATPSGRPFYIDTERRCTTWVDPRLKSGDSLPEGWEEAYDDQGVVYYIDHNTQRTQRDHPHVRREGEEADGASLGSWGSLGSLISAVSGLTRSASNASIDTLSSTYNSAMSLISRERRRSTFASSTPAGSGMWPTRSATATPDENLV